MKVVEELSQDDDAALLAASDKAMMGAEALADTMPLTLPSSAALRLGDDAEEDSLPGAAFAAPDDEALDLDDEPLVPTLDVVGHRAALDDDQHARLFREDPCLDRRIIEGMLDDREAFLATMTHEGFSTPAVLRRAAELGLSEALVRQVKGVAADLAGERPGRRAAPSALGARTCLSCDRVFLSSGPGNRLCMRCRGGDAGLAQL